MLIVCSGLSIAKQRKIALELAKRIDDTAKIDSPTPVLLDLPWLRPEVPVSTFHNSHDEEDAQSALTVAYEILTPKTLDEYILQQIALDLINRGLYAEIREKRNIAYSSQAGITEVESTNHGAEEGYYALEIVTGLAGFSLKSALDGIHRVRDNIASDERRAKAAILGHIRKTKERIQGVPSAVADDIAGSAQVYYENTYDPKAELAIIDAITIGEITATAQKLMSDRRLVVAAGPTTRHLKDLERHAARSN